MNDVFVLACDGTRLMPTSRCRARKLLKAHKARIFKYQPFTIMLTYESERNTQPIELCMDTGSEHIGISIKSEKHEFVHARYDNLSDEKEKHNAQRMYRRTRRNRLRYRKARFDNRRRPEGWTAPSVSHKKENHIHLFEMYAAVCPITSAVLEVGQFDPAAMQAYEEDGTILEGTDYQKGRKYQIANTREAVFVRDHYTCQVCGKSVKDGAVLAVHHILPRSKGGTDRLNNLLTVCTGCHTSGNHKPGGKLYGLKPVTGTFRDAAFMNIVRWQILNALREEFSDIDITHTYGSYTKASRRELGQLAKTHANDAYAMGTYHPKHRHQEEHFKKRRRNNRILSKFYDAKYLDIRDRSVKKGDQIGCNRTKRNVPRNNPSSERVFRGHKISKGYVSVRRCRYSVQSGDTVLFNGRKYVSKGVHCNGSRVILKNVNGKDKSIAIAKIQCVKHVSGWQAVC